MIRTLLVDDEPLARDWLRGLLDPETDIEVVGECGDGRQAIERIGQLAPDLVFLDVQMPEVDGFGVVETLGRDAVPVIIFVTAFDRYALRAFDAQALDYLLKPFDGDRLKRALDRARTQLDRRSENIEQRLVALVESMSRQKPADRLVIKNGGRVSFLPVTDIDWVEACGNYVGIHTGAQTHLLLQTMNGMEARLDPNQFLRIHRSTIVNIDRIRHIEPMFHGEYSVEMQDGARVTLSRGYRDRFQSLLDRYN